jgi:hypothetical protein
MPPYLAVVSQFKPPYLAPAPGLIPPPSVAAIAAAAAGL